MKRGENKRSQSTAISTQPTRDLSRPRSLVYYANHHRQSRPAPLAQYYGETNRRAATGTRERAAVGGRDPERVEWNTLALAEKKHMCPGLLGGPSWGLGVASPRHALPPLCSVRYLSVSITPCQRAKERPDDVPRHSTHTIYVQLIIFFCPGISIHKIQEMGIRGRRMRSLGPCKQLVSLKTTCLQPL